MPAAYDIWLLHHATGAVVSHVPIWYELHYTQIVNGIGEFSLTLPPDFDFRLIHEDTRVAIWRAPAGGKKSLDYVGLVRLPEKKQGNATIQRAVRGKHLNDLLHTRIVAYAAGSSQSSKSGAADDLMKDVVTENLGSSGGAGRDLSAYGFTVQAKTAGGTSVALPFAYQQVDEVLKQLSDASHATEATCVYFGIVPLNNGWECEFRTKLGQWGMDHRFPSGVDGALVLSPDRQNVKDVYRATDYSNEVNFAYIGGQGEGSARVVRTIQDATRVGASPFNRRETFVDGRSLELPSQLDAAGQAAVKAGQPKTLFSAKIIENERVRYGVNYGLGDYITVSFDGETFDCRIESVQVDVVGGVESLAVTVKKEGA